jgi:hypothetical protein
MSSEQAATETTKTQWKESNTEKTEPRVKVTIELPSSYVRYIQLESGNEGKSVERVIEGYLMDCVLSGLDLMQNEDFAQLFGPEMRQDYERQYPR